MAVARRRIEMIYQPRRLQAELHAAFKRFNVVVCHRRFGKSTLAINQLIGSALRAKRGSSTRPHFAYIGPLRHQVKNIAWDPLKHYASPFTVPANVNESELRLDLLGNARIQLFGADNPDAARGLGFDGVVFDEFGDMDPTMWSQVVGPALSDRKGWALFIGTPKGDNEFKRIYESAERDTTGDWFARTLRASETGILDETELARWRELMSPEEYAQEFECSFVAPVSGSYYGKLMEVAQAGGRIGRVPFEPGISVHCAWDLGVNDATAIWMFQLIGREIRIIDYIESSGVGLDWYVNELRKRPYPFGTHILPHDASVRELGTGRSRVETLSSLGVGQVTIIAAQSIQDGINAVRQTLPRCWFNDDTTRVGRKALSGYRAQYDSKRQTFSSQPLHDWASNGADAFRYLALGLNRLGDKSPIALKQQATPTKRPQLGIV